MADNYSVDDILAEIAKKRDSDTDSPRSYSSTPSVTEILGGDELSAAMKSSSDAVQEQDYDDEPEYSVQEDDIVDKAEQKREARRAAQLAKEEQRRQKAEEKRLAEEKKAEEKRLEEERRAEELRIAEEKRMEAEAAAREAARAAEAAKAEAERFVAPEGFTGEIASPSEASRLFADKTGEIVQSESEYVQPFIKPEVSGGDDDDIVFHTRRDLIISATQQIRKKERIEAIERALLQADMDAESPDELLDSLNPMESLAKAADTLKAEESAVGGDTLAVAGNDFRKIAGEDHVKEYSPVTSRKKSSQRIEDVLMTTDEDSDDTVYASESERRSSSSFVEKMNKKIKEQRERQLKEEQTVVLTDVSKAGSLPKNVLNIDEAKIIDSALLPKQDPVDAVRRADELAGKRRRKIADFVMGDIESEIDAAAEEDEDDYDEEEEEIIDLDDESVISDRLSRSAKGLLGRLIILGVMALVAIFVGLINDLNLDIELISSWVNRRFNPEGHIIAYLVIGAFSFVACSSVITNGFSRLVRLKPDGDTLCALAHTGALLSVVLYLAQPEYVQRGRAHIYIAVSLVALCFNTISKLCTVKAAQKNFELVSRDSAKYYMECFSDNDSDILAKDMASGQPVVASMHKTELLCDFIISAYCEDASDRIARAVTPVVLAFAVAGGLIAYIMGESEYVMNNASWAATVATAVLSVGATFVGSLIVMLPMLTAAKKLGARNAAVLGYNAVDEFSETDAVITDASTLFPAGTVVIANIWDYNKHGRQHIDIDEALIYASSLAVAAGSVTADAFYTMLRGKKSLLQHVENCVYENGLGVSGWIKNRRVYLGSRELMKQHNMIVPDMDIVNKLNERDQQVVYLAINNEVCILFFFDIKANPQVKSSIEKLYKNKIGLAVKTVDGFINDALLADLFDIDVAKLRVLPYEAHEAYEEHTKYASKGSAAVCCDGTFSAMCAAVCGAKTMREKILFGCTMEVAGIALGILLAFVFALFTNYDMFSWYTLMLYNLVWLVLTVIVQAFKRI